jgi:hypothetical protein
MMMSYWQWNSCEPGWHRARHLCFHGDHFSVEKMAWWSCAVSAGVAKVDRGEQSIVHSLDIRMAFL